MNEWVGRQGVPELAHGQIRRQVSCLTPLLLCPHHSQVTPPPPQEDQLHTVFLNQWLNKYFLNSSGGRDPIPGAGDPSVLKTLPRENEVPECFLSCTHIFSFHLLLIHPRLLVPALGDAGTPLSFPRKAAFSRKDKRLVPHGGPLKDRWQISSQQGQKEGRGTFCSLVLKPHSALIDSTCHGGRGAGRDQDLPFSST